MIIKIDKFKQEAFTKILLVFCTKKYENAYKIANEIKEQIEIITKKYGEVKPIFDIEASTDPISCKHCSNFKKIKEKFTDKIFDSVFID